MGMPTVTTIKVPTIVRDRISRGASERGITAAALITELLDSYDREQRLAAVGRVYAADVDAEYVAETRSWDEISAADFPAT